MENIIEGRLMRSQSSPNLHLYIEATEDRENDFVPEHQLEQVVSGLEDINRSSSFCRQKVCLTSSPSIPYIPLKPALLGSGLIDITLSTFIFILPNTLCHFPNILLSALYIVATFCTPFIFAIFFQTNQSICLTTIIGMVLIILIGTIQVVYSFTLITFFLLAPVISLLQNGSLNLCLNLNFQRKYPWSRTVFGGKYLLVSRGWPTLILSLFFIMTILLSKLDKSKIGEISNSGGKDGNQSDSSMSENNWTESCTNDFFKSNSEISGKTLFSVNILLLFCIGLLHVMTISSLVIGSSTISKVSTQHCHLNSNSDKNDWRTSVKKIAKFYFSEPKIHFITPLAFFVGLEEAFMTRDFIHGIVGPQLGLSAICSVLLFVGIGRALMTWVACQIGKIASTYFELFFGGIFQLGLLIVFINWTNSLTDHSLVFSLGFIWGSSSMAWEFLILSHSNKLFFSHLHNSSSIISFYKSFGMAVMYSLDRNFESINLRAYFNLACFSAAVISIFVLHRNLDRWSTSK